MNRTTVNQKVREQWHSGNNNIAGWTDAIVALLEEQAYEMWKEGYKARYKERWGATILKEGDLITLYRERKEANG